MAFNKSITFIRDTYRPIWPADMELEQWSERCCSVVCGFCIATSAFGTADSGDGEGRQPPRGGALSLAPQSRLELCLSCHIYIRGALPFHADGRAQMRFRQPSAVVPKFDGVLFGSQCG